MKRTVSDVMTRTVVSVNGFTPFKDIVRRMQDYRVSAVPVVDEDDIVLGIVSEGDLILKEDADLEGEPRFLDGGRRRHDRSKAAGRIASELIDCTGDHDRAGRHARRGGATDAPPRRQALAGCGFQTAGRSSGCVQDGPAQGLPSGRRRDRAGDPRGRDQSDALDRSPHDQGRRS